MSKNILETYHEEHFQKVCAYAKLMFEKHIKPYLLKHNYTFLAGNGTWYVSSDKGTLYPEDLPKYITKVLETEIPGFQWNDLGSLMPDFKP